MNILVGESVLDSGLFVFALIWTVAFLLLRVWRYRRQASTDTARSAPPAGRAKLARPSAQSAPLEVPDSVRHWEVHLHELARDLSAQIDTKLGLLQQMLRLAEEQQARLEALLGQIRQAGERAPDSTVPLAGAPVRSPQPTTDPRALRRQRMFELADAGLDPLAIAQELGEPVGEVELILSLRPGRRVA